MKSMYTGIYRIGIEAQALDDPGSTRDAMYNGRNIGNMDKYHFVTEARLSELKSKALKACGCAPADRKWLAVGEYIHALEDTYAHSTGKKDRNWDYYNGPAAINGTLPNIPVLPKIPKILPRGARIGGSFKLGYDTGHGAFGHTPDWTWRYPEKSMKMAESVLRELKELSAACGEVGKRSDWNDLKDTVGRFVNFTPDTYTSWVVVNGVGFPVANAKFDSYDEKIKILDPNYNLDKMYKVVFTK
jgi:hypothetical protein